jgi:hypothetical protein
MKRLLVILCCVVIGNLSSNAQLCPGGGLDFLTSVTFDPAWIYGCNTGTSCNGGVALDNRNTCLPVTLLDICAPAPSCGTATNGSNVWFKFFATGSTATISCFQNTSFVIGIQAFSGGPLCGTMTQVGCAVAAGPSSGVQLGLTGLVPGNLYHFRIFGSATPVAQRTGLYCFCGTTGLSNFILPVGLTGFSGKASEEKVQLAWETSYETGNSYFDIERGTDGKNFTAVGRVNGSGTTASLRNYHFTDDNALKGINYYRLKEVGKDGKYTYSETVMVRFDGNKTFSVVADTRARQLQITLASATGIAIYNLAGQVQQKLYLTAGTHTISTVQLANGVYFVKTDNNTATKKIYIY